MALLFIKEKEARRYLIFIIPAVFMKLTKKIKENWWYRFRFWLLYQGFKLLCEHSKRYKEGNKEICWRCGKSWKIRK